MKKLILIIEDDKYIQRLIEKAIQSIVEIDTKILKADCAKKAIEISEQYPIDIFIIDIKLPDYDGITLAEEMRKKYPYTPIIFETDIQNYKVELDAHRKTICVSFLKKPFSIESIVRAIETAIQYANAFQSKYKILEIKRTNTLIRVNLNEIIYLEASGGDIHIFYYDQKQEQVNQKTVRRYTLKKIEDDLENRQDLIQCHRSYMINPKYIEEICFSKRTIELEYVKGDIPIGSKYIDNL